MIFEYDTDSKKLKRNLYKTPEEVRPKNDYSISFKVGLFIKENYINYNRNFNFELADYKIIKDS